MATSTMNGNERNLRHKSVKVYDDDEVEDEIDGKRTFDVMEKVQSNRYNANFVAKLSSEEFSYKYIQRNGFATPIHFTESDHLGMLMPDRENFTVNEVRTHVGGRRMLDVMECVTQRAMEMSMRDFAQYFESSERKRIYNVISLEFSNTRLGPLVKRPAVVDSIDWIDLCWPPHLKFEQSEQTNKMSGMKYPKVQKYCLMSVRGCYTDFHVDFGGTSVWYHVLKYIRCTFESDQGGKLFWLIPPTNKNLEAYERWTLSGKQGDVFFADTVDKCQRVELKEGDSLMIPSGWIHSVYTPKDSIVFGGNFLHSFNIPMQLRIAQLEERLHVPPRFRFPFFQEVLWYALERYVCNLKGKSFLTEEIQKKSLLLKRQHSHDYTDASMQNEDDPNLEDMKKDHIHLTPYEYKGIQRLLETLQNLPENKRFVPDGIADGEGLLAATKEMLWEHSADDAEIALTGHTILGWPKSDRSERRVMKRSRSEDGKPVYKRLPSASRVRRVRCKECIACMRDDCGECVYCRDMKKYGGPGTMKQSCLLRRCMNPLMPSGARAEGGPATPAPKTPPVTVKEETLEDDVPPVKRGKKSGYRVSENSQQKTPKVEKVKISKEQSPLVPRVTIPRIPKKDILQYVIRPPPSSPTEDYDTLPVNGDNEEQISDAVRKRQAWMQIFQHLSQADLTRCMRVCKTFLRWGSNPALWQDVDLSESEITQETLRCIVRRMPSRVDLTRSYVSSDQLSWLLKRCPSIRNLILAGSSWSVTAALCSASCPPLHTLALSWVSGFTDSHLKQLISPPTDGRPGQQVTHTRLRFCRHLYLNGTDITDAGVSLLPSKIPHLHSLDLSYCTISDKSIKCLVAAANNQTCSKLTTIVARSCPDITQKALKYITEFKNLSRVDLRDCCQITEEAGLDLIRKKTILMPEVGLFEFRKEKS